MLVFVKDLSMLLVFHIVFIILVFHIEILLNKYNLYYFVKHELKGVLKYIGVEIWTHHPGPHLP